jgi:cyclase
MLKVVGFMMCVALSIAPAAAAPALAVKTPDLTPVIKRTEIAKDIYQFTVDSDGYVEQLNSVAIVTDRDILVFDTDTRPSSARAILAQLRQITSKPVRYVVNSHWHPDHWTGNQVYAEAFTDLEIIATEDTREFMVNSAGMPNYWKSYFEGSERRFQAKMATGKTASGNALTVEQLAKTTYDHYQFRDFVNELTTVTRVYPTLTYTHELVLRHGGREFRFMSLTGDALGTTVLYLPNEKVLLTGDVVVCPLPTVGPTVRQHVLAIRELEKLDWNVMVPGHGPALHDRSYMELEAEFMDEIARQITAAIRRGAATVEEAQSAVDVEGFRNRFAQGNAAVAEDFPEFVSVISRVAYLDAYDHLELHKQDLQQ